VILVQRARVAVEILVGSELGRIDEDADHGDVAAGDALTDQRAMALMQKSHGGHEAHPQAGSAIAAQAMGQGLDRAKGEHGRPHERVEGCGAQAETAAWTSAGKA
jgi:hypothetical protein